MSLLNAVQSNQDNRMGSVSSPSVSTGQQHNATAGGMAGMDMKHQHHSSHGSSMYGHDAIASNMHVKPEIQQQHSTDSIDSGTHARSPSSLSNMGNSIMDACSRYGITGGMDLASPAGTPASPDGPSPGVYDGSTAAAMAMAHSQQLHNPYGAGGRSITSPHGTHCMPGAFHFSVNNLINRKYPKI